MYRLRCIAVGLCLLAAGCGWDGGDIFPGPQGPPPPPSIPAGTIMMSTHSGDGQSGRPGEILPIGVLVERCTGGQTCQGAPVPGATVTWHSQVQGHLSVLTSVTDSLGWAYVTVQFGLNGDPFQVTASALGVTSLFQFVARPFNYPAGTISVTHPSGDRQVVSPGQFLTLGVLVVRCPGGDTCDGAPIAGATVTWSILETTEHSGDQGHLSALTSVTDSSGLADVTYQVGLGAGIYYVNASVLSSITQFHNTVHQP
jgi:hypothetical protein